MNSENNNVLFAAVGIVVLLGAAVLGLTMRSNSSAQTAPQTPVVKTATPTIIIPSVRDPGQKQAVAEFTRPTPTPTDIPVVAAETGTGLCSEGGANDEPEILVGYSPAAGESVGPNGLIKVWVNDEGAPFIAPNEVVDPATGQITTPGDRTATAPDGYLWEPALYIFPQKAENGGTPHFPFLIKGDYSNTPPKRSAGIQGAPIEIPPSGTNQSEKYTAEYIWQVDSLGLGSGRYQAQFVIHDGDDNRGVGCINIVIQ